MFYHSRCVHFFNSNNNIVKWKNCTIHMHEFAYENVSSGTEHVFDFCPTFQTTQN